MIADHPKAVEDMTKEEMYAAVEMLEEQQLHTRASELSRSWWWSYYSD